MLFKRGLVRSGAPCVSPFPRCTSVFFISTLVACTGDRSLFASSASSTNEPAKRRRGQRMSDAVLCGWPGPPTSHAPTFGRDVSNNSAVRY